MSGAIPTRQTWGYHYNPLDFVINNVALTSTLALTNGVAVGVYGNYGINLTSGSASLVGDGGPLNLNHLTRYQTVQEQPGVWGTSPVALIYVGNTGSGSPTVSLRFTDIPALGYGSADGPRKFIDNASHGVNVSGLKDCQLRGSTIRLSGYTAYYPVTLAMTNNLIERGNIYVSRTGDATAVTVFMRNNLYWQTPHYLWYDSYSGGPNPAWEIRDNLFDNCTMTEGGTGQLTYILNSRNGYVGTGVLLAGSGGSDKPNLSSDYVPGPLGGYYYPASGGPSSLFNLINAGSRSPAAAALYQYTVKAAANSKDGTESPATVDIGYHYVAVNAGSQPLDTDGDGMADFAEDRNGNGTYEGGTDSFNWQSADTDGNGLGDLQQLEVSYNVLVNDPAQDYGNEQNTQFESTVAVLDGNVIAAYVDANQGVYGFGSFWQQYPGLPTPRFVGYSVSQDRGVAFTDKGNPPLSTQGAGTSDDGDAGDPVLAVDRSSRTVYLAGTSSRNAGHKGIPLWTSTDGGVTFGSPVNVRTDVNTTDKPWIAVDNTIGTGLHDLYLTFTQNSGSPKRAWLTVSADGSQNNWTTDPSYTYVRSIGDAAGPGVTVFDLACPIVVIGSNHVGYVFWLERTSDGRNWLRVRQALNRGTALGSVNTIRELVSTTSPYGILALKRTDNPVVTGDTFRAFPFPVPAVNPSPSKANHLYVAYADKVQGTADNADIFLVRSTDGGANWTAPVRVNNDATLRDQWMPVLAVKPDGTKLLGAWYDRRNDPNNSMIEVYGRWENIATDGTVTLGTEFKISTASFPPVFAGTLPGNTATGQYDPVYPPGGLDLTWHYGSAWPSGETTVLSWRDHVGEYDGAWADGQYVYVTWTDNRLLFSSPAPGAVVPRNNRDIRFVRITWP